MESLFRREEDLQLAFIKPLLCARQVGILHMYPNPQKNSSVIRKYVPPF